MSTVQKYVAPAWVTARSVLEFDPESEHRTDEAKRVGVAGTTYWIRRVSCGGDLASSFVEAEMRYGESRGQIVQIPMTDVLRHLRLHHYEPQLNGEPAR